MQESEMRPLVRRHYAKFVDYLKQHGPEMVTSVLKKGHHGKARLTFKLSNKDRYQMLQVLGLVKGE